MRESESGHKSLLGLRPVAVVETNRESHDDRVPHRIDALQRVAVVAPRAAESFPSQARWPTDPVSPDMFAR
ncbi:MAG: hypothetical protein CMJ59_07255 [Planctomycetaceae bacterium]|nr:hypothetical protein [Planctomycetaceae bacterium]